MGQSSITGGKENKTRTAFSNRTTTNQTTRCFGLRLTVCGCIVSFQRGSKSVKRCDQRRYFEASKRNLLPALTTNGSDLEPTSAFGKPLQDRDRCTRAVSPAPAITDAACSSLCQQKKTQKTTGKKRTVIVELRGRLACKATTRPESYVRVYASIA